MTAPPASVERWADVAGLALVGALAAWAVLVSGGDGGRVASFVALLVALVAATVAGRALAGRHVPVAGAVAVAILSTVVLTFPELRAAGGAPTGYANTNATLTAVGAIAAIGAATAAVPGRARQAWVVVAGLLGGATALTGSAAGTASLAAAVLLLLVAAVVKRPQLVPAAGLVLVVLAAGVTGAAAASDRDSWLRSTDAVRVDLWQAGVELAREEPLAGVGVGAFEARNPLTSDPDLRWVHHEYVELALEVGGVGLLITFGMVIWTAARLWLAAGRNRGRHQTGAATAAAAAIVVGLHATVDHVWHEPAPIVLAALLIGAATTVCGRASGPLSVSDDVGEWVA